MSFSVNGKLHSAGTGGNGRLGLGNTADLAKFVEVKELENVAAFAVADNHNVALSGGKVYTWGDGTWSKLGHGDVDDKHVPSLVHAFDGIEVTHVAAGGYHTLVVSASGEVYSWGWGKSGRLGIVAGPEIESDSTWVEPLPKVVKFPEGVKIVKVAAGQSSSAAISAEGVLYTWGSGRWGALGLGLSEDDQLLPLPVEALKHEQIVEISIGDSHMIAQTKSNKIYTWGRNDYGQLGRTDQKQDGTPAEVPVAAGEVTIIAAGKSHSLAAIGSKLYAWGNNSAGQLGVGKSGKEPVPKEVNLPNASTVTSLSAGWAHTITVHADGSVYGFGSNLKTQLGFANS
jgi:alpha-tubulin suppressor-like RCC1 family protein